MASIRVGKAAEKFFNSKQAQKILKHWKGLLTGKTIKQVCLDTMSDDIAVVAIKLENGQEFYGPMIAHYDDDEGRFVME